jgi:hypothetical protein
MKHRFIGLFIFGMFLSFSGMSCGDGGGGGGNNNNYYSMGPIGVMMIVNMDYDKDGAPDGAYQYVIMVRDDTANNMLADPPLVTMPGGSTVTTYCGQEGYNTVCSTFFIDPDGGSKANVPPGDYSIANAGGVIVAFTVDHMDLLNPDPAYADTTTMSPAPGSTLFDPAMLDWEPTAGGAPGDIWEFGVDNMSIPGGDWVEGESDWAVSDFNIDLPDTWADTDALEVEIISQKRNLINDYYQVLMVHIVATGYTLDKP